MLTHYVITVTALQSCQDDPIFAKYKRLNEALVGVVEDYSLVSFTALSVQVSSSSFGCVFTSPHSLNINGWLLYSTNISAEQKVSVLKTQSESLNRLCIIQ